MSDPIIGLCGKCGTDNLVLYPYEGEYLCEYCIEIEEENETSEEYRKHIEQGLDDIRDMINASEGEAE